MGIFPWPRQIPGGDKNNWAVFARSLLVMFYTNIIINELGIMFLTNQYNEMTEGEWLVK
jgi:hypothetical protein